jgi:hypothetical protein
MSVDTLLSTPDRAKSWPTSSYGIAVRVRAAPFSGVSPRTAAHNDHSERLTILQQQTIVVPPQYTERLSHKGIIESVKKKKIHVKNSYVRKQEKLITTRGQVVSITIHDQRRHLQSTIYSSRLTSSSSFQLIGSGTVGRCRRAPRLPRTLKIKLEHAEITCKHR